MTYTEIATMLTSLNLPVAYNHFTDATATAPPFIVFFYDGIDDVYADNTNYQRIVTLNIELYTDNKDFTNEAALEAALTNNALTYTKEEAYIDSEKMFQISYETEVLITNGEG